jgi:hypothetical protein
VAALLDISYLRISNSWHGLCSMAAARWIQWPSPNGSQ